MMQSVLSSQKLACVANSPISLHSTQEMSYHENDFLMSREGLWHNSTHASISS